MKLESKACSEFSYGLEGGNIHLNISNYMYIFIEYIIRQKFVQYLVHIPPND